MYYLNEFDNTTHWQLPAHVLGGGPNGASGAGSGLQLQPVGMVGGGGGGASAYQPVTVQQQQQQQQITYG